jgi:hypothetical protein
MDEIIKKSKLKLQEVQDSFKTEIVNYLQSCDYTIKSKKYQVVDLKSFDDIQNVFAGVGFYVIMTSMNFADNESQLKFSDLTAIYRGHSYKVKDRLMSHLFSNKYKTKESTSKYPSNYSVCLKIEDGVNGIDIDQKPYSEHKWKVIVHKMKGSTELIRQQTEHAFDDIYKQPIKSREKKNSR